MYYVSRTIINLFSENLNRHLLSYTNKRYSSTYNNKITFKINDS